jgi:glycosyltransferase involved in cell wall biosynthesis
VKPEILIGSYISTYGLYSALSSWHPFVLFVYGSDIVEEPQVSPFHRWLAKYVLEKADLILVDSDIQERAALLLGAGPDRIVKFPWFDLRECDHVPKDGRFRKMLGWRERIVVICVRMHEKRYKVDTLLKAVPLILKENQNVRFLLCGRGSQTMRLKAAARDLGVEDVVYFAGVLPKRQLVSLVKDCDVYVSTSRTDGTSASLLEAMSSELPCVVTDIPGNREWIKDAKNGLLFQVGDHEALASLILKLSNDCNLRTLLGESAASSVRLRINWKRDFAVLLDKLTAMTRSDV